MNYHQSTPTTLPSILPHALAPATTRESERLVVIASIGGLFLLAGLALVALAQQFRSIVFLVFLFMSVVAPQLSAYLVYLNERRAILRPSLLRTILTIVKAFLLAFLITLIGLPLFQTSLWSWIPVVIFLLASATAIGLRFGLRSISWNEFASGLDAYIVVAIAAAVFVLSPFNPSEPVPIGLINYALGAPNFFVWFLIGAGWTMTGIWLRRHEGWAFPHRKILLESLAIAAVSVVLLGLYDDSHFADFSHYMPLVGPAMHGIHGGIPMVDTYSQYGFLPWFTYRVAFAVFEPTFGTAAVVLRLLNLCYFAVIFSVLVFVSRRRLSALWFFIPALLVAITSHGTGHDGMWNMNALPMTLGGRYLLPASMTLLLVAAPRKHLARWTALVLIMLASLSSTEILAFTLVPWGYCLLLEAVRSRSVGFFLRWTVRACTAILATQLAFIAVIYLSTGAVVSYGLYFDLISQFRPAEESSWSVPFVPEYALWFPICCAYFIIMAAASFRALRGDAPDSVIERLLPVAALGFGPLAYFFGRPQEATLNISCLAFAVVAIGIAEAVFINARRFGHVGPALSAMMVLAFSFTIADGLEHFMRPLDASRGNSTILRRCFTEGGCRVIDALANINLALHSQPLDPRTKVGYYVKDISSHIEEVTSMLRRLAPNAHYVGMLVDFFPEIYADPRPAIGMTSFMATGQWYAWSISSPVNDGSSPLITDLILKRVGETPSEMLVIISNQQAGWAPINNAILERLVARCRLSLVETGKYHSAFLTENCAG